MNVLNRFEHINWKKQLKDSISIIAICILLIGFTLVDSRFLSMKNISNLLEDISTLLILSSGITFVLLIGSIDLSIGTLSSCAAVLFVMTMPTFGSGSYVITLAFGIAAGLIAGFLHVVVKLPSFIATFGLMSIWRSLAMIISKGSSQQIQRGFYPLISWYKVDLWILPLPFVLAIIIVIVMLFIEKKTKLGRATFAIGGNEAAARMCGLNITFTKITIFMLTGLFSAIAGIVFASKMKSGIPSIGEPFSLMAIAAVVLGGTSLSGGIGGILKSISGVILIVLIQNGMNIAGISAFWQQATFGIIILVAVYLTTDRSRVQAIVK